MFYRGCLQKEFQVLGEGWHSETPGVMKGRSDNYLPVLFPSDHTREGQFVQVLMERVEGNMVIGSFV